MQRALSRNTGSSPPSDPSPLAPIESTLSCLWVLTPLAATVSVLVVIMAISTNQWLHTEEKMNNPTYNGTGEKDYLSKLTISGLWILCFTNPGETLHYNCTTIDHFSKEEYSPDLSDSTMAIPYTVTRSVIFFLTASLLLCGGYCCCILGQCVRHRTLYTFISGVIFIVTGLVMLFGLIVYISIFKAEIGSKLRPRSLLQPPVFDYWYGYSFLLFVGGLITTQLAGISSIFLFIYKVQYEWLRKHLDDSHRGKNPPVPNHCDAAPLYPCRRHPQAYVNSNSAIHFPARYPTPVLHEKRYFFSKEPLPESPCSVHRPAHSASLKDVSTHRENFYDFPPPPTISYQFDEPFESGAARHLPRDLTANTVSTTADVNCDGLFDDYSPGGHHDFVTFDLDQPLPLRAQSNVSIVGPRNGGARKTTFDSDTLRRTTPV